MTTHVNILQFLQRHKQEDKVQFQNQQKAITHNPQKPKPKLKLKLKHILHKQSLLIIVHLTVATKLGETNVFVGVDIGKITKDYA